MPDNIVERLLRISDNAMDSIAEKREPIISLADTNTIDTAASLITKAIEALETARMQIKNNHPKGVILSDIDATLTELKGGQA
jgi:hypothetical protein